MEEDKPTDEQSQQGAFNSAVATLMRIDKILIDIKDLVLNKELSRTNKHIKKHRLLKELFVQAYPLLEKERRTEIKGKIKDFKFKTEVSKKQEYDMEQQIYFNPTYIIYAEQKEDELNDLLMEIQDALQDRGYFMPSKEDTGL